MAGEPDGGGRGEGDGVDRRDGGGNREQMQGMTGYMGENWAPFSRNMFIGM
ncbi:hypothetical protein ACTHPH_20790 [Paenibacillus pasadenensis]|uniref:hypothetical protein n=1 Tax=Paenibacillus TaxID=44249 RepID=UPI00129A458F|nr:MULTISPECIES: hypothetical protein [Paenibacillus]QGG58063.1 hypothetical protein GE073_22475 [Paenibacillus sp. B01]